MGAQIFSNPCVVDSQKFRTASNRVDIVVLSFSVLSNEQADQILVVDDGRIVEQGTHEELIRQPGRYQQFVRIREKAERAGST